VLEDLVREEPTKAKEPQLPPIEERLRSELRDWVQRSQEETSLARPCSLPLLAASLISIGETTKMDGILFYAYLKSLGMKDGIFGDLNRVIFSQLKKGDGSE
jgi:hypothetical protein